MRRSNRKIIWYALYLFQVTCWWVLVAWSVLRPRAIDGRQMLGLVVLVGSLLALTVIEGTKLATGRPLQTRNRWLVIGRACVLTSGFMAVAFALAWWSGLFASGTISSTVAAVLAPAIGAGAGVVASIDGFADPADIPLGEWRRRD